MSQQTPEPTTDTPDEIPVEEPTPEEPLLDTE